LCRPKNTGEYFRRIGRRERCASYFCWSDEFCDRPGNLRRHGAATKTHAIRLSFFTMPAIDWRDRLTRRHRSSTWHDWAAVSSVYIRATQDAFATGLTIHRRRAGKFWRGGIRSHNPDAACFFLDVWGRVFRPPPSIFGNSRHRFRRQHPTVSGHIKHEISPQPEVGNELDVVLAKNAHKLSASCMVPYARAPERIRCCQLISSPKNYGAKRSVAMLCLADLGLALRTRPPGSGMVPAVSPNKVLECSPASRPVSRLGGAD